MNEWSLRVIESPQDMLAVEELQRLVWPGNETEIVPAHLLIAAAHNGGVLIGAYTLPMEADAAELIGFVFGFPGLVFGGDGPHPLHCSHMLAVHPDYRDRGLGFALKRAQWQMVRYQKLDHIIWTYDPLQSRNAYLNITKLGAVCNTYQREVYGVMRDGLNFGLPSDRFVVDWWVNSRRVERRLSRRARQPLDLAHFFAAGVEIINPTTQNAAGWPVPTESLPSDPTGGLSLAGIQGKKMLLLEIPAKFPDLKAADPALALRWRLHTRALFEGLFDLGYLVTEFIHLPGSHPRGFYVLTHGESTL
jgi:predicted GNAT superfamily acetyltransferase